MHLDEYDRPALEAFEAEVAERYRTHQSAGLALDLARGNPSIEQVALSSAIEGVLHDDFTVSDGGDARGYGGLDGIPEAKALAAQWLGVEVDEVVIGGNSSLTLMYFLMLFAYQFGLAGRTSAWRLDKRGAKFLCPTPGYDRHFKICEEFDIEMLPVPMRDDGPDMDEVERRVTEDRSIKGMWCVPKFSNPTGQTYSDDVVRRVAALGASAPPEFRVIWDNAYAVHDLHEPPAPLLGIMDVCRELGTEDSVILVGSTSKVTFAGAGLAFLGASKPNLDAFRKHLAIATIGPDKVNQLRHVRFLRDMDQVRTHMARHAAILRPKFACVEHRLSEGLGGRGIGTWSKPRGGYFVSFDARPGLAREIVEMAGAAGVRLTPAGAAFPYGRDPNDSNIRLAPSFPPLAEIERVMDVFVTCVELASVRQRLATMNA